MTPSRLVSRPSTGAARGSGPGGDLVLRRASVLDPRAGIDGVHDVVVRDGEIAELAEPGQRRAGRRPRADRGRGQGTSSRPSSTRTSTCARPGDEDEEDIETGTRAAAAGGYCGILAMANTQPARGHGGGRPRPPRAGGRARHPCPTGFLACVTRGMEGEELTEMAELRDAGAVGFSDDGLPISNARVMRRALQYQRLVGAQIALHEEDHDLSRPAGAHEPHLGGVMHEGVGLGGARARRGPVGRRVDDDRPRRRARRLRGRPHPRPAPVGSRVGGGGGGGQAGRGADHLRGDARTT